MPDKKVEKIYYTDTLAAAKRFEEVKKVVERRKRVDELMALLPQGHLSDLNADMIDGKHFEDLIKEILILIQQQLPKTIGGGGRGAMGPPGPKGDRGDAGGSSFGGTSRWYNGIGKPDDKNGVNNDYYLDDGNGDVYEKANDTWGVIGNIEGPKGDPGLPGGIPSEPPAGKKKITNIYWDPNTEEVVIEYES